MILSFCWNKRAHRDTRADFIRLKGNEGLALSVFTFTITGPLRSAWAVPIEMASYFTGSEMSLPKTKAQWHFPRLKHNGMSLTALAGSESSALLHTWSGQGFQHEREKTESRHWEWEEQGWFPIQFLILKCIYFKAVDVEEQWLSYMPLTRGSLHPLQVLCAKAVALPRTCSPSSLLIKNGKLKDCDKSKSKGDLFASERGRRGWRIFFSSPLPWVTGQNKNNSGTSSRTKHFLESFNIAATPQ